MIYLMVFIVIGIVTYLLFKFTEGASSLGSVEATFVTITLTFNRLIHENPDYLLSDNREKLMKALIRSRWAIRKYEEDLIGYANEFKSDNPLKDLIYWMLIYEYNPPLTHKLSPEQEDELNSRIHKVMESFFSN